MGMFDYLETEAIICPHCKKSTNPGLQFKQERCSMDTYHIGEMLIAGKNNPSDKVSIKVIGNCSECNVTLLGFMNVVAGVIKEVEIFEYSMMFEPSIKILGS